jgi:hypothetical protein
MSYSIIAAVLLVLVALSSSTLYPNSKRNAIARFYSDFAQLYRPATLKPYLPKSDEESTSTELYQFLFTEKEYSQISEESLTMVYTDVIERSITYYSMPNFMVNGSRYFYRRDPKQTEAIEIELINPKDRIFREVRHPDRYFYLSSFENLEYLKQMPLMPYYEVTFICKPLVSKNTENQTPLLSYIDKNLQWTPRYILDLPMFGTGKKSEMYAYADIRNNGEESIVIKEAELTAGDIKLTERPVQYYRSSVSSSSSFTRPLGEQATGTYVYQLATPSSIFLAPHSMKSITFFEANITVKPFLYYSSVFSPVNSDGKLTKAYNITSHNDYIPNGRLTLREQGRFMGEINLPDITMNETYTMKFGYDADVSYRRQVKIIQGDENADKMTYHVEYLFENYKSSRDVYLYFTESFSSIKNFEIKNISTLNDNENLPALVSYGTDLRGYMLIPRQRGQKMISYNVIVYKLKQTITIREQ